MVLYSRLQGRNLKNKIWLVLVFKCRRRRTRVYAFGAEYLFIYLFVKQYLKNTGTSQIQTEGGSQPTYFKGNGKNAHLCKISIGSPLKNIQLAFFLYFFPLSALYTFSCNLILLLSLVELCNSQYICCFR